MSIKKLSKHSHLCGFYGCWKPKGKKKINDVGVCNDCYTSTEALKLGKELLENKNAI